jgi:hypothetical protein
MSEKNTWRKDSLHNLTIITQRRRPRGSTPLHQSVGYSAYGGAHSSYWP